MAENNSVNQISCIALGDLIKRLSLILRGNLQTDEMSGKITLSNEKLNKRVNVCLTPGEQESVYNILIDGGVIGNNDKQFKIARLDVEHLYVTWDTPRQISLCYTQDSRYSVINIDLDTTIVCVEGKDRRRGEKNSQATQKHQNLRRKFYHIGTIT